MKPKITVIGPRAFLTLEGHATQPVPAKVDTGADSSSIWASNIIEEDGTLSFVLFDPTAPWYTGKVITTRKYSIKSIKNSFGTSEFRYKVPLRITLEGRTFKANFTLANRANNRYPILIGRQTLKNRFVVDVARVLEHTDPVRVLVLAHVANTRTREAFDELTKSNKDLSIDVVRYDELMVTADSDDTTIAVRTTGRNIASYDFIYFMTRVRDAEMAAMVSEYAKRHDVVYVDRAGGLLSTDTKAHQSVLLSGHGLSIPQTVYMATKQWSGAFPELKERLGLPFIFKDNHGRKGRNNFLIHDEQSFAEVCAQIEEQELQMVAQAFIPNDGYYRVVVLGKNVALVMYRSVDAKRSHLHSKKADGPAEMVEISSLPGEAQQLSIAAAQLLSLEVAGVDILQDKNTGIWYCLEVNNSPQLVGGAFVDEKMKVLGEFFVREASK